MKKVPFMHSFQVWFCGGPTDQGLEVKSFSDLVRQNWTNGDVRVDHWGVGESPGDHTQNWVVNFSVEGSSGTDSLESKILEMLDSLALTTEVIVKTSNKWSYRQC